VIVKVTADFCRHIWFSDDSKVQACGTGFFLCPYTSHTGWVNLGAFLPHTGWVKLGAFLPHMGWVNLGAFLPHTGWVNHGPSPTPPFRVSCTKSQEGETCTTSPFTGRAA
jgi:hypothetical protein